VPGVAEGRSPGVASGGWTGSDAGYRVDREGAPRGRGREGEVRWSTGAGGGNTNSNSTSSTNGNDNNSTSSDSSNSNSSNNIGWHGSGSSRSVCIDGASGPGSVGSPTPTGTKKGTVDFAAAVEAVQREEQSLWDQQHVHSEDASLQVSNSRPPTNNLPDFKFADSNIAWPNPIYCQSLYYSGSVHLFLDEKKRKRMKRGRLYQTPGQ